MPENEINRIKVEIFDLIMAQESLRQQINTLDQAKVQKLQELNKIQTKLEYEKHQDKKE